MISGEKDMLLIDPPFSLSEAHRLAAEILESKIPAWACNSRLTTESIRIFCPEATEVSGGRQPLARGIFDET
jgi:hypothetical protein